MSRFAMTLICILGISAVAAAQDPRPDRFAAVRFMAGDWNGTSSGEPGAGTVVRHYEFILGGRFLHERNTSTYPPQEKNKSGEVHEHWSFISYDKQRATILFRQFHQEGFVVTYALNEAMSTPRKLVFVSEQMENIPSTWKAKETYEVISADEFVETFEIAQGDKPFAVYSRNHFKRSQ